MEPPTRLGEDLNTAEQLTEEMITLSLEPKAKWQNLLNLDTIKVIKKRTNKKNKETNTKKMLIGLMDDDINKFLKFDFTAT